MNLKVELNLDDIFTGADWSETIGEILRDELKGEIRAQMKKAVKEDKSLQRVIKEYKNRAVRGAMDALGLK